MAKQAQAPVNTDIEVSRSVFSLVGNLTVFINKRLHGVDQVCEETEKATIDCVKYGATSLKSAIPQAD